MTASRIIFALLAPAALLLAACGPGAGGSGGVSAEDRTLGDPEAPVTVIEYASITCPVCKSWHDDVWPEVRTLIDAGQIYFVFRELPTAPADVSMAGFLIARCVPESRYFSVLDTLFDRQERLVTAPDRRAELLAIARAAGLTEDQFNACIRDEDQIAAINARVEEGARRYGATSTPSFVINGRTVVGYQPLSTFEDAVAQAGGSVPAADDTEGGAQ